MEVRTYVERSILVPDHVMTRLMLPRLQEMTNYSWLLDGKNNAALFIYAYFLSLRFALNFCSNILSFFSFGFQTNRTMNHPWYHRDYIVDRRTQEKSFLFLPLHVPRTLPPLTAFEE